MRMHRSHGYSHVEATQNFGSPYVHLFHYYYNETKLVSLIEEESVTDWLFG